MASALHGDLDAAPLLLQKKSTKLSKIQNRNDAHLNEVASKKFSQMCWEKHICFSVIFIFV